MIVVRYADDSIVGFEHRHEAEQFLADLKVRLASFGLTLHPDKTRLIEFGRRAIASGVLVVLFSVVLLPLARGVQLGARSAAAGGLQSGIFAGGQ